MCGVFAMLLRRPLTDADIEFGRAGRDALAHRGPDGSGEWFDRARGVYFGHRRLAIVDVSAASNQPMVVGPWVLTFNGEIYNFREVRTALEQAGERFETTGDVEVLLKAWRRWGEDALDRFDGMFAFAIWDGVQASVAVDPFGEKALFAAETPDGIYLSSELAPLLRVPGVVPELPAQENAAYLALGYIPGPATAYRGVRRVGAHTVLTIRDGRIVAERSYWTVPIGAPRPGAPAPLTEAEVGRLQEALAESLGRRLIADVPLCAFLSAGVDSSLVAAIARKDFSRSIECVSVSFNPGQADDEAPLARETAEFLGLEHQTIAAQPRPHGHDVADMLSMFAQPFDAATSLSIRQMTAAVRTTYKVGLTGSGGDEITLGYGKNAHFYRHRHVYALAEPLRRCLGSVARVAQTFSSAAAGLALMAGVRDEERYLAQKNFPTIEWLRRVPGFAAWSARQFGNTGEPTELVAARFEVSNVMPNLRLVAMDVGSMRSSVELRTPFLSRRVIETVASFDPRAFIAFGQKSVLRRILKRYLPDRLVDRPKRGFTFPQERLLAERGDAPPAVPGLDPALVSRAWARRNENGWRRIAVRLVLLEAFWQHANSAWPQQPRTKAA